MCSGRAWTCLWGAFLQRYRDEHPTHHVILLEVPLRTVRVCVMAPDACLRNGFVRIDRLQIRIRPVHDDFGIGMIGILEGFLEPSVFELVLPPIPFINRPEADKPVSNPGGGMSHQLV